MHVTIMLERTEHNNVLPFWYNSNHILHFFAVMTSLAICRLVHVPVSGIPTSLCSSDILPKHVIPHNIFEPQNQRAVWVGETHREEY